MLTDVERPAENLDWSGVDIAMSGRILEQAEKFMAAQLQTALAADQRAVSCASMFVGVAVALLAAALGYYGVNPDASVLSAGIVSSSFMITASAFCFWAARPCGFYFPGNYPEQWWPVRTVPLNLAIGGETENYQERIRHNAETLDENAKWLKHGALAAITAPVAGLISWFSFLLLGL